MACYVRIREKVDSDPIEIPTQRDGTLLLSSVSAQFPDAVGLRFKSRAGAWRGVKVDGNMIDPPLEGWEYYGEFYVVKRQLKRVANDDNGVGPVEKISKEVKKEDIVPELMVGGLPFSATEDEVKKYFGSFGELDMCDLRHDREGKCRGFGFIQYKSVKAVEAVLTRTHNIYNRKLDVRYSKKGEVHMNIQYDTPTKLFVGRLPKGTTGADLVEYFSKYGVLKDVDIPVPYKGYGFIVFASKLIADEVLNETHMFKGAVLNVSSPIEKKTDPKYAPLNQGRVVSGAFGNYYYKNIKDENIPTKLFVGNLPAGTTVLDLQEYFSRYGVLKDVYILSPFRGHAFVTFGSQTVATRVLNETHHVLKGHILLKIEKAVSQFI